MNAPARILPTVSPASRAAMAMLAHLYLRFGREAEAASLLAALALVDPSPNWARRTRCVALLRSGHPQAALAEAEPLLDDAMPDRERAALLLTMALACWRLGDAPAARKHLEATKALNAANLVEPAPKPVKQPSRRRP